MDRARLRGASRRTFIVVAVAAVVLLAARAVLPVFVTDFVNEKINSVPGVQGGIGDVDLHLWRGAYTVHDVQINQVGGGEAVPIFSVPRIEMSVHWRALLRGALVGSVELHQPQINIVAGRTREDQRSAGALAERFRDLSPLRVNRLALIDGELHFRNFSAQPEVDIYLDGIQLEAHNLTNSERISETLVATVNAKGRAMRSGSFSLDMKLDPFAPRPTYELAFALEDLPLPELNNFLRHYLAVVAQDGRFSMYAESTASDGRFKGYVKPLVRDLDLLHIKRERTVGEAIKGFFVKIFDAVFENSPREQVATRIEFSGTFENPEIDVLEAISSFMRNAFVQAIEPGIEGSVAPQRADEVRRRQAEEPAR